MFEGDGCSGATAYSKVNGTDYAVCTTIQYGYRPSSNSTMLTVEPQATQVVTTTKTPEQMQQEAQSGGWLSVYNEWSWWYPWYRLHAKIHVNPTIDVGFNPILPGGETAIWDGLEFFQSLIGEMLETTLLEAMGLIGTYLLARATAIPMLWLGIAVEIGKNIAQTLLFLQDWDNAAHMLASGVVSIAMMFFALVDFYIKPNFFTKFVDALWRICGQSQSALRWVMVKLTEMAEFGKLAGSRIVDGIEIVANLLIAITALIRYTELTLG
jgi:hypothetical protein